MGTILSGEQKKRVVGQKLKERRKQVPQTAQQTLGYEDMYSDGVCLVDKGHYSKCICFGDINYKLASEDEKKAVFNQWSKVLNSVSSGISLQVSCINQYANPVDLEKRVEIPMRGDDLDEVRAEFDGFLKTQIFRGNNGMVRRKYITFGVQAGSLRKARDQLKDIETELTENLSAMNIEIHVMSGYERLKLLHDVMNPESKEPFLFNYDMVARTGLSTRDFVAPTGFDFRSGRYFRFGERYGAISFLQILGQELQDELLSRITSMENAQIVSLHLRPVDQAEAIRELKRHVTDLDRRKIDEQKKAVRDGYDMDVLPTDLVSYGADAKEFLEKLRGRNQRLFLGTILIMHTAKSRRELEAIIRQTESLVQGYNCTIRRLDYRQEDGMVSCLPLGIRRVDVERSMSTASMAGFVPFSTEELFQDGEAVYYGVNQISGNMILANRKLLTNPNGLKLAVPGGGKSFAVKREMVHVYFITKDCIIVTDPEGEYVALVTLLHGQVIEISPNSKDHINPMDISLGDEDEEERIRLKSDFILSMFELIMEGDGMGDRDRSIIDRCVHLVYREFFRNPQPERMPTIENLYRCLLGQEDPGAERIAGILEIYVTGSLNFFNHRTNVDLSNRLLCFNIRDMGRQLSNVGMLVVQEETQNLVRHNRDMGIATWNYIDEFHRLLRKKQTAAYMVDTWKTFRKWGGIPTGITQNCKDFLMSPEIENILENSEFIYLLNQAAGDRQMLADRLHLSQEQVQYITNSRPGSGLMIYGNTVIPFEDHFPRDTKLYKAMTTKPSEIERKGDAS